MPTGKMTGMENKLFIWRSEGFRRGNEGSSILDVGRDNGGGVFHIWVWACGIGGNG